MDIYYTIPIRSGRKKSEKYFFKEDPKMDQIKNNVAQTLEEISAEMLELLTSQRKVVRCNYSDSRSGGTNYAAWTETHEYQITEPNGDVSWYSLGYYTMDGYRIPKTIEAPEEIRGAKELSWEEVPKILKETHFREKLGLKVEFKAFNEWAYSPAYYRQTLEFLIYAYGVEKGTSMFEEIFREIFVYHNRFCGSEELAELVYDKFGKWASYSKEAVAEYQELVTFDNGAVILYDWSTGSKGEYEVFFLGTEKEFQKKYSEIFTRAKMARVPFNIAYITRNIKSRKFALSWIDSLGYLALNVKAEGLEHWDLYPKPKLKTVLGHQMTSAVKDTYNDSYRVIVNYLVG